MIEVKYAISCRRSELPAVLAVLNAEEGTYAFVEEPKNYVPRVREEVKKIRVESSEGIIGQFSDREVAYLTGREGESKYAN